MALIENIIMENCRLCQCSPGNYEINSNDKLIFQIFECTKIQVNDDVMHLLPNVLCKKCKITIENFIIYREKVIEIDECLRKILRDNNTEVKIENNSSHDQKDTSSNLYKCNKCSACFIDNNDYMKHLNSHTIISKYICSICTKSYKREGNFIVHKRSHLELYCFQCNKTFDTVSECETHLCTKTVRNTKKIEESKLINDSKEIIEKNDKFDCNSCENEALNSNFNNETPQLDYTCTRVNCGKVCTSAYTLKIHELKHQGKRLFLCVTCGKNFITKNSLICHEKIHLEIKGYNCKLCDIGFSVRSNLRAHEKKYHEGIRYYCSQCTKAFVTKCSLDRHERTHTGIKDFQCTSCPAAFYTNKELIKHQRYHQGLRQYKCDECFKTFFERHHLVIHLRSHTGERPYVCKIPNCGKSFTESQKLKRHQKARHTQLKLE